jgi:hypothetical protein
VPIDNNDELLKSDPLVRLVQPDAFVGWAYDLDYETVRVLTNDAWKVQANGIPFNAFLVATAFNPNRFSQVTFADEEVLLLRVTGAAPYPHGSINVEAKINHFQAQRDIYDDEDREFDDLTKSQVQWSALACRILGTFYRRDGDLKLGSDIESFVAASRLRVYRPHGDALRRIVTHVDVVARRESERFLRERLGITADIRPIRLGTVRYTASDRMHRASKKDEVDVYMWPADFVARRTAVFGMTRTGKSNLVKHVVTAVKAVADEAGITIGQLIYDINGEYANANEQDQGSIADVFGETDVVRYRMLRTQGFRELQNNFYVQPTEGHGLIVESIRESNQTGAGDVKVFLDTSFEEPPKTDVGEHKRWEVRVALFHALLRRADFEAPSNFKVTFDANDAIRTAVRAQNAACSKHPNSGLTLDEAVAWFLAAREANRTDNGGPLRSSSGRDWFDADMIAMVNMLAQRSGNNTYINGYKVLTGARDFHSPRRDTEVAQEVYDLLAAGKVVILDLSVGDARLRDRISKQIADKVLRTSMSTFTRGDRPPPIVIFVEEAHNLLGKKMEITDTWPRIAKEGAKFLIGLVYATQEVSSLHSSILAATENWFVTHLNNEDEIRELAKFYDFADFAESLIRAQDVGFARVKTLRSPFVVPTQIAKFEPASAQAAIEERRRGASAPRASGPVRAIVVPGTRRPG